MHTTNVGHQRQRRQQVVLELHKKKQKPLSLTMTTLIDTRSRRTRTVRAPKCAAKPSIDYTDSAAVIARVREKYSVSDFGGLLKIKISIDHAEAYSILQRVLCSASSFLDAAMRVFDFVYENLAGSECAKICMFSHANVNFLLKEVVRARPFDATSSPSFNILCNSLARLCVDPWNLRATTITGFPASTIQEVCNDGVAPTDDKELLQFLRQWNALPFYSFAQIHHIDDYNARHWLEVLHWIDADALVRWLALWE